MGVTNSVPLVFEAHFIGIHICYCKSSQKHMVWEWDGWIIGPRGGIYYVDLLNRLIVKLLSKYLYLYLKISAALNLGWAQQVLCNVQQLKHRLLLVKVLRMSDC